MGSGVMVMDVFCSCLARQRAAAVMTYSLSTTHCQISPLLLEDQALTEAKVSDVHGTSCHSL